jgi:hypothetical protein
MGLQGREVALAYRQLESFVVGATSFDFADAPLHLSDRWERMGLAGTSDVATGLDTIAEVDRLNEEAFEASLRSILASFSARRGGGC